MSQNPQSLIKTISNLYPEFKLLKKDLIHHTLTYQGFIDSIHIPKINPYLTPSKTLITSFDYDQGKTIIHYSEKNTETTNPPGSLTLNQFKIKLASISDLKAFKSIAKLVPQLPPTDRALAGRWLNEKKLALVSTSQPALKTQNQTSSWLDVTAPGKKIPFGHLHLITEAIIEIETIFASLGFIRRRYPEIESDWYYAEGLNIPKDHPARDDQETFYFSKDVVLTAHTSNGQLREMEIVKTPPIKMINIGKTYRRQASNTHSPMFHQFEGLLIDRGINITHLIGVSNFFVRHYFGPDRKIRLRPHHFQFTEPSFEVDINCYLCKGSGMIKQHPCKVCKSGWLELGGAGMVHPQVLKNGGLDAKIYSGFAFGWGVERIIMMKHQVTDNLRTLYSDDMRYLTQS